MMQERTLSSIHPGEVFLEDFMKPPGLSQYRLAHDIGVAPIRISQIIWTAFNHGGYRRLISCLPDHILCMILSQRKIRQVTVRE